MQIQFQSIEVGSRLEQWKVTHTATVKATREGQDVHEIAEGDSQIDAFRNALEKLGINWNSIPAGYRANQGSSWDTTVRVVEYLKTQS